MGRPIVVHLDDVVLRINDQGELEVVGVPNRQLNLDSIPSPLRKTARDRAYAIRRDSDRWVKKAYSRQVPPGWKVNRFSYRDGNIGVQFNRAAAPA